MRVPFHLERTSRNQHDDKQESTMSTDHSAKLGGGHVNPLDQPVGRTGTDNIKDNSSNSAGASLEAPATREMLRRVGDVRRVAGQPSTAPSKLRGNRVHTRFNKLCAAWVKRKH